MKTIKTPWKRTPKINFIFYLLLSLGIIGCSKDDAPETSSPQVEITKSSARQITSFVFLLTNNPIETNVVATIDEENKTITATMPIDTDLTGLLPEIQLSDLASINLTAAQNFTEPVEYTVTAEDGSTATYTAIVTAALSQRNILQIILDENPGNTLGWNIPNSGDLGILEGVTTNINGDIIELEMNTKLLVALPSEIGFLTALEFFMARNNELTSIPPEIGQLTSLEILLLDINGITTLPQSIGNLSSLVELEISNNNLTAIPAEIGQLSSLKEFDASGNQINTLPSEFFQLTELTGLRLGENQFSSLPREIGFLTKLRLLKLSNNQLTSLPPEMGFLLDLEALFILGNNISFVPRAVCNLVFFNNLSVDNPDLDCPFSSTDIDALISIYSSNPDNTLGWSVDNYPGVDFNSGGEPVIITANNKNLERIASGIESLGSLEVLNMNSNTLVEISPGLGGISALTTVTLGSTGISSVPNTMGSLTNLTLLSLTNNPITSIPQEVCDLQVSNGGILTILTDPGEGCD